jgi:hypothetical protein
MKEGGARRLLSSVVSRVSVCVRVVLGIWFYTNNILERKEECI